jgi:hypothetical protein
MVHLVRLILDDDWHPVDASAKLREPVGDAWVLRQMAARAHRAMLDRSSEVTERAVLTFGRAHGRGTAGMTGPGRP